MEGKNIVQQKKPKPVVGAFIFNEKGELFLMKSPKWNDKYVCPGGGINLGEDMAEALKREVKEETNMKISDIEYIAATEDTNLGEGYTKSDKHLIFLNFKAKAERTDKIKLNEEATKYKWLSVAEWLKKKNITASVREVIEKYLIDTNSFEDKYKRALADYQNLLRRTALEKQEFAKYANESLLYEIIPVYDNLRMALNHNSNSSGESKDDPWLEGVKYVVKQFKDVLEGIGIEEIKTIGEKFDHHTMEAVEGRGEIVIKEAKPGYKLKGKTLIPAKVILSEDK